MISVVCVYNDENKLKTWLLESLKNQTAAHELVMLDNTKGTFTSAAAALNHGAALAKGDYFLFAHQDVKLCSDTWLEHCEHLLEALPRLGVAGVAGMAQPVRPGWFTVGGVPLEARKGVVYYGPDKTRWVCADEAYDGPVEVQTLDEQVLIVPRNRFDKLRFDESVCRGWHLYGVDYSLSIRALGYGAYIIPLPVWHSSLGSLNEDYYGTLKRILAKHRQERQIATTCGSWHTSGMLNYAALAAMALKSATGQLLRRNTAGGAPYIGYLKSLIKG